MLIRYKKNKVNTWDENYSPTVRLIRDETLTKQYRERIAPYREQMAMEEVEALIKKEPLIVRENGDMVEPLILSRETMEALQNVLDNYEIPLDFDDIDGDKVGAVVAHIVLLSVGYQKEKLFPKTDHIGEDPTEEDQDEIGTVSLRRAG